MKKIISILLACMMLLSIAACAEGTSKQVVISDISVTLNGETYELSPTITYSEVTSEDSAMADFFMTYQDQTLFPIQSQIDADNNISLLMGSSATVTTIPLELLLETMNFNFTVNGESVDLLSLEGNLADFSVDDIDIEALEAIESEAKGDAQPAESTFQVGEEEFSGNHIEYTIDNEHFCAMIDAFLQSGNGALNKYFLSYCNLLFSDMDEDFEEITSFAQLLEVFNISVSIDVSADYVDSEERAPFVSNDVAHISDESGTTLDVYVDTSYLDAEHISYSIFFITPKADMPVTFNFQYTLSGSEANTQLNISDEEDVLSFTNTKTIGEEGTTGNAVVSISSTEEGYAFDLSATVDYTEPADGDTSFDVDLQYSDSDLQFGTSFLVTASDEAVIDDRITNAESRVTIATEEDLENNDSLYLSIVTLAADLNTLMSGEDVAALMAAFYALGGDTDYIDYTDYGHDDPSELSFAVPEITYLPDGYTLEDDPYIYADLDMIHFYVDNDETYSYFSLSVTPSEGAISSYTVDGTQIADDESGIISITRTDDSVTAGCVVNGMTYSLYADPDLSDEEIIKIFNGIVIPEETTENETTPKMTKAGQL